MRMVRVRAAKEDANKEEAMPGAVVVGGYLVGTLCSQRQGRCLLSGTKQSQSWRYYGAFGQRRNRKTTSKEN